LLLLELLLPSVSRLTRLRPPRRHAAGLSLRGFLSGRWRRLDLLLSCRLLLWRLLLGRLLCR